MCRAMDANAVAELFSTIEWLLGKPVTHMTNVSHDFLLRLSAFVLHKALHDSSGLYKLKTVGGKGEIFEANPSSLTQKKAQDKLKRQIYVFLYDEFKNPQNLFQIIDLEIPEIDLFVVFSFLKKIMENNLLVNIPRDSLFLGPLAYISKEVHTMLHCDLCDAANLAISGKSFSELYNVGISSWENVPATYADQVEEKLVAEWLIFHRSSLTKVQEISTNFFNTTACVYHGTNSQEDKKNPLMCKQVFFDLDFVKSKFESHEFTVINQHVGELVVIPAGCAHQVKNFGSSVKVAFDFLTKRSLESGVMDELEKLDTKYNVHKVFFEYCRE